MKQYNVNGMSCAACSARVEKVVSAVEGVTSCSVSLLTNSMGVEGTADPAAVIKAVTDAGYSASVKGSEKAKTDDGDTLKDTETPKLLKRLIASLVFLVALMYLSMGHMMLGLPVPAFLDNHVAMGLAELLLAAVVMVINQKFFISGFRGVIQRAPNMDTLVALGSGTAFCYSTAALFVMINAMHNGDHAAVEQMMKELYFESAAMILTLITVGKLLEAKSKGRTTDALKGLMSLAPKKAVLVIGDIETEVDIDEVKTGDTFVVRQGERIPVDGVIIEGSAAVDESALTGESIPVDKTVGSSVSAATFNRSGYILCRATRVGEDTTLSQIIKLVSDAAATKAPIAKLADRVSGVFVPAVILIAVITLIIWLIIGADFGVAIARAIAVLVISCPCALGLATPVAIMVGSGVGARNGILFKTAVSLEETGRLKTVVLDKTGTVTKGEPVVTDIMPLDNSSDELLRLAYSLEKKSGHPLAEAVVRYAEKRGVKPYPTESLAIADGSGLSAEINGETVAAGNERFISSRCAIPKEALAAAAELSENGKTPLYFSRGNKISGIIAVADAVKPGSREAVAELKRMGLRVVMLTGDNERTARAVGRLAGIDEVIAGVLPDGKAQAVEELKKSGKVAMVGDGINDAPALTAADVGIAIGTGTDVAIDAADVVLMKSLLGDVPAAIKLGRATLRDIRQNLFWAFIYNIIGIPLAAGAYIGLFGWRMDPMFGAAAMSLSSFCVVMNALRLNLVRLYPRKAGMTEDEDTIIQQADEKEIKVMTKTMKIEGMMCMHCEARVKKSLEALDGVEAAEVSHEKGTAVVTLSKDVADETLAQAVEAQDYKVTGVE